MGATTFDTLAFVKKLREAGVPQGQAEATGEAVNEALEQTIRFRELATRKDLYEVEARMTDRIQECKLDILKWMVSGFLVQAGVLLALLKL